MAELRIGVVGCGTIVDIYLKNLVGKLRGVRVVALADLLPERARAKAREYGIGKAVTTEELLADPEVDLVLNLTVPLAHSDLSLRALEAGKHVYSEKPLAIEVEDGVRLVEAAESRGLYLGCAPDTFLGAGIQACLSFLDSGAIGEPIGASAFMVGHGPEAWHKDPAFFYKRGGGPVLDVGPYYFTALTAFLGPAVGISGSARSSFPERVVGSGPKKGERIAVEVPTHVTGCLEFASGAIATYIMSFDVWHSSLPRIELYGSEGSMIVPDPNFYRGPVLLRRAEEEEWREVPVAGDFIEDSRGLGIAELASALAEGRPCRASGRLALQTLEIMRGAEESGRLGRRVELARGCSRPSALGDAEASRLRK